MAVHKVEQIVWAPLERGVVERLKGRKIFAARADGKLYAGTVIGVDDGYLTLANGNQRQLILFVNHRFHYAVTEGPPQWIPKMAEQKLL